MFHDRILISQTKPPPLFISGISAKTALGNLHNRLLSRFLSFPTKLRDDVTQQ